MMTLKVGPLLLGLLLTLSCVNAVSHDHDDDHDHDHDHDNGFHAIQHRLDAVVARIQRLRQKVGRRTDDDMINKARSLRVRVQHIEGSGCDDHSEFQCGGTEPECQSLLFVCDGKKDCRNGADEAFCTLPTKKGDYFEGHMIWDVCTQRKPDKIGFEVTDVEPCDDFPTMARLHANVVMEYEDELIDGHDSLPVTGRYHFGRHFLTLDPVDTDRLGIYCQFDGYDLDRCEGHIAHEASGNVCAEFIFVRKHDDHHIKQPDHWFFEEYHPEGDHHL